MKRIFVWMLALFLICGTVSAIAESETHIDVQNGHVTGEAWIHLAPQWGIEEIETYLFDLPEPEVFPDFSICKVEALPLDLQMGHRVLEGLIYENSEENTWYFDGLDANDEQFVFGRKQEPNMMGNRAHEIGKRPSEDHPNIENMRRAEEIVYTILERMEVDYEKPLRQVEDVRDLATEFAARRKMRMESGTIEEHEAYALSWYPTPDIMLLSTRIIYGGLPATQEASVPEGAYQGNNPDQPSKKCGNVLFGIDDAGKVVYAQVSGLHRVTSESPFEGELLTWEEAFQSVLSSTPNFLAREGKGFWDQHYGEGYYQLYGEERKTVLAVTPACYILDNETVPAWCFTIRFEYVEENTAHVYECYVDAITGEYLRET